ncbi:hypothetical protein HanHA300_Chr14g0509291 [Helianthus annuus]|nr:hypothetical protein HanHA300_Chr14g0509291 [Helianthus annuus]
MEQMSNFEMVAVQAWQRFGRSNQCTVQHGKDIWDGLSKVELPVGCSPPLRMFGLFIHRGYLFQLMSFLLVSLYYTFICIFTFVAIGSWLVLIYCLLLKNDVVLGTNICKTAIDHDILT